LEHSIGKRKDEVVGLRRTNAKLIQRRRSGSESSLLKIESATKNTTEEVSDLHKRLQHCENQLLAKKEENSELSRRQRTMERELAKSMATIDEYKEKMLMLEESAKTLSDLARSKEGARLSLEKENADLRKEIDLSKTRIAERDGHLRSASCEKARLRTDLDRTSAQLKEAEGGLEELLEKHSELTVRFEQQKCILGIDAKAAAEEHSKLAAAEDRVRSLESIVEEAKAQRFAMEKQCAENTSNAQGLTSRVGVLADEVTALKEKSFADREKLKTAERRAEEIEGEKQAQATLVDSLRKECEKLRASLEEVLSSIGEAATTSATLTAHNHAIATRVRQVLERRSD